METLPDFPIYIVSKGRATSRLTSRALDSCDVFYRIVVEKQEYKEYARAVDKRKLLVLDDEYREKYDPMDTLGCTKSLGPGPARNFAWEHSLAEGHSWHWVMDDNIKQFIRLHHNKKTNVRSYAIFRCMQDFTTRFSNVSMSGPCYRAFIPQNEKRPPFIINTRIYSCNLIRNDAPFRWRGRYNEDTDLSLRMLKSGWCTIQFNAFLQDKLRTQTIGGGNTAEFYAKEGTLPKSQMLVNAHPDVAKLVVKYGRWHHHVDYSRFKANKLIYRDDITIPSGVNNYGLTLRMKEERTKKATSNEPNSNCASNIVTNTLIQG